jgi:Flp pilus assembly protein TadD
MRRNRYRFSSPGKRQSAQLFGRLLRIGLLSGAVLTSQLQSVWPRAKAQGTLGEHTSADAQLFFHEAGQHLRQGDTEKAIAAAREGLKIAPLDVAGWNLFGLAYTQHQDLTHADAG